LEQRTRDKIAHALRKTIDLAIVIVANDSEMESELRRLTLQADAKNFWSSHSTEKLDRILDDIGVLYTTSEDKAERRYLLSMIASALPLNAIREVLPGLTAYQYSAARKLITERKEGKDAFLADVDGAKVKYEAAKVNLFIEFITRCAK
jgi:hypothetical protein